MILSNYGTEAQQEMTYFWLRAPYSSAVLGPRSRGFLYHSQGREIASMRDFQGDLVPDWFDD